MTRNNIIEFLKIEILKAINSHEDFNLDNIDFVVEKPKLPNTPFEYATNIAFICTKKFKKPPYELAYAFLDILKSTKFISNIEVAKPGFINFDISISIYKEIIEDLCDLDKFLQAAIKKPYKSVLIEYISGNPTGYLHVGHLRHAVVGSILINLFNFVGIEAKSAYYINDAGNQIVNLAKSVYYQILHFKKIAYEEEKDIYVGPEIKTCAKVFLEKNRIDYKNSSFSNLCKSEQEKIANFACNYFLEEINKDLKLLNIKFDYWISEKKQLSKIEELLEIFKKSGDIKQHDGAIFAKTTSPKYAKYADDKDRVLVKSDGSYTYLVPDILGHKEKYSLKDSHGEAFDRQIDIFGADHHGYVPRLKCLLEMAGLDVNRLDIIILQLVKIQKDGQDIKMSKRLGTSYYLRDLIAEVGQNASRFISCSNLTTTKINFDIQKIKEHNNENLLYYSKSALNKCDSLLKQYTYPTDINKINLELLSKLDKSAIRTLAEFPTYLQNSINDLEPNVLFNYLSLLSRKIHLFYNNERIISKNTKIRDLKLFILSQQKNILTKVFQILGLTESE